jgi:hypothetical protein
MERVFSIVNQIEPWVLPGCVVFFVAVFVGGTAIDDVLYKRRKMADPGYRESHRSVAAVPYFVLAIAGVVLILLVVGSLSMAARFQAGSQEAAVPMPATPEELHGADPCTKKALVGLSEAGAVVTRADLEAAAKDCNEKQARRSARARAQLEALTTDGK